MNKAITELAIEIKDISGREVNEKNLFKYCYTNKMQPSRLCYILMTCSRLVRSDYLEQFEKSGVWDNGSEW